MTEEREITPIAKVTNIKKKKYLENYLATANRTFAAEAAGVSYWTHYAWLKNDPEYKKAFEAAKEIIVDRAEDEAWRRGMKGIDKPIYYKGQRVDVIKEYSDILLMFMMKGERPDKYNEKVVQQHIGDQGGPIRLAFVDPEEAEEASAGGEGEVEGGE